MNRLVIRDNNVNVYGDSNINDIESNVITSDILFGDGSNLTNLSIIGNTGPVGPVGSVGSTGSLYPGFSYLSTWNSFSLGGVTNFVVTPDVIRGYPIYIRCNIEFNSILYRIVTGVSGSIIYGIYKYENSEPTSLIWSSDVLNTTPASTYTITVATTSISEGSYIICYNTNSSPNIRGVAVNTIETTFPENEFGINSKSLYVTYSYSGSLPSLFPSGWTFSTDLCPKIQFGLI